MSRHNDELYVGHMRDACDKAARHLAGAGWLSFLADEMKQDAVIRALEIVGEAGGKVSKVYRTAHPEIPWRVAKDLRNALIHGYAQVDLRTVWGIASVEVPALRTQLQTLFATIQPSQVIPPSKPATRDEDKDRGR